MKVFPNVAPNLAAPPAGTERIARGRSPWVGAAFQITCGLVYLGISTVCHLIWPNLSDTFIMIAGAAGFVSFLLIVRVTGLKKKWSSPEPRESSYLSSLMAEATGWAVFTTLIMIATLHMVKLFMIISACAIWVCIVCLDILIRTLVNKLPGPPSANS